MKKIISALIIIIFVSTIISPVSSNFCYTKEMYNKKNFSSDNTELKWMIAKDGGFRCIRSYWLHVPPSYDGSEPVPLVINLHGAAGFNIKNPFGFFKSCFMEKYTGFSEKADEEGFIIVYPNGKLFFRGGAFGFDSEWYSIWFLNLVNDVGFIKNLIEKMEDNYNINSSRIYVTGHSSGGFLSYAVASWLSDRIAAIAPNAGAIGGREYEDEPYYYIPVPENPVAVIAFHGTNDSFVPYENSTQSVSVNQSISFWVENNGCDAVPDIWISDTGRTIKKTYKNGSRGTEVILYTTVGGSHCWPGNDLPYNKNAPWLYDPFKEITATDLIWDFFEKHPKQ
jgi:polyhydroxybutyrate depolymerase